MRSSLGEKAILVAEMPLCMQFYSVSSCGTTLIEGAVLSLNISWFFYVARRRFLHYNAKPGRLASCCRTRVSTKVSDGYLQIINIFKSSIPELDYILLSRVHRYWKSITSTSAICSSVNKNIDNLIPSTNPVTPIGSQRKIHLTHLSKSRLIGGFHAALYTPNYYLCFL